MNNINEDEALKMLQGADIKEMLTFLVQLLSAYPSDELKTMRERVKKPGEVMANEEIALVIDEILRARGESL